MLQKFKLFFSFSIATSTIRHLRSGSDMPLNLEKPVKERNYCFLVLYHLLVQVQRSKGKDTTAFPLSPAGNTKSELWQTERSRRFKSRRALGPAHKKAGPARCLLEVVVSGPKDF